MDGGMWIVGCGWWDLDENKVMSGLMLLWWYWPLMI